MRVRHWGIGAIALVGCFLLLCVFDLPRAGVEAQRRGPATVTRIYTGPDGQAQAEVAEMKLTSRPAPFERSALSETVKANGFQLRRWAPGYVNDWHPASQRSYMIGVSGQGEIEIGGAQKITIEAGKVVLFEDITGKGHVTRTIGSEDCVTANVFIEGQ